MGCLCRSFSTWIAWNCADEPALKFVLCRGHAGLKPCIMNVIGRTSQQRQFDVVNAIKKELCAKKRLIVEQVKVGMDKIEVTNKAFLSLKSKLEKLPPMDETLVIDILSLISGSEAWSVEQGKELAEAVPITDTMCIPDTRCLQQYEFFEAYMRSSDWDNLQGTATLCSKIMHVAMICANIKLGCPNEPTAMRIGSASPACIGCKTHADNGGEYGPNWDAAKNEGMAKNDVFLGEFIL